MKEIKYFSEKLSIIIEKHKTDENGDTFKSGYYSALNAVKEEFESIFNL